MAKANTLREYLVGIGFDVDQTSLRKFEDSLKRGEQAAQKFAGNMAIGFTAAAGAAATALAAVGAGVVALGTSTANQDLQFQVFARRMFLGETAARKMKIALDSLGYSMEEVIWGPPELAERYRQLILDQTNMIKVMGGETGERAFRKIRDIEFQFTRMGPELTMFSRKFTEDLVVKMFGSLDNFENKLKHLNDWFQANIPAIADKISNLLAPAFKKLADFGGAALQWATGSPSISREYFARHGLAPSLDVIGANLYGAPQWNADGPTLGKGFGEMGRVYGDPHGVMSGLSQLWGRIWDPSKSFAQNMRDLIPGESRDEIIGKIERAGRRFGGAAGSAELLALIDQETGGSFNPLLQNPRTGALGLGQILPRNWPRGKDPASIDDQIAATAGILFGNLKKEHGNLREALRDYYGHGVPGPGEPTFDQYYSQYMRRFQDWRGPLVQPQSYQSGAQVHIDRIEINGANLTKEQLTAAIKDGTREAIDDHVRLTAARSYAQRQGSYV